VFIDGDVILAEHGNLEFDWLVNVFNDVTGHNHDGTVGGGAAVPLLKDLTLAQDFTLSSTGVTGSVILDEIGLVTNSDKHLATQKSIKLYVDTNAATLEAVDIGLQSQIDVFENSNHGHINLSQLNQVGLTALSTVDFEAVYGYDYLIDGTSNTVDCTLPVPAAGQEFLITNSRFSTNVVQVLNPTQTIKGAIEVAPGTNIILAPGDTIRLVATDSTTMEVI